MKPASPRRPRASAAHPAPDSGAPRPPGDDPWAGDDETWDAARSPETGDEVVRLFRGVALASFVGVLFWGAIVAVVVYLL